MARPIARSTSKPTSKQGRGGGAAQLSEPDKPWLFRTYAGHSTAAKSNELYRNNLAKGQTGPLHRLRSADADGLRLRS